VNPDVTVALSAYLTEATDVTAGAALPPDPTFPALRVTEISTADGDEVDDWSRSLVQIDVFDTTRAECSDLARTVSQALLAAANWTDDGVTLGRAEMVRRRPAHDTSFDPPQPRWIVTAQVFAKPS
jgi:hypothetical protein